MPIHVKTGLVIPDSELNWRFSTSGGPGGQHANKASTRAQLSWAISGSEAVSDYQRRKLVRKYGPTLHVAASDERSQARNKSVALERLGEKVREGLKTQRKRTATKPTRGSQKRRLKKKRKTSEIKQLRRKPKTSD